MISYIEQVGKLCSRASLGSEERLMEGIDLNRNIWVLDMRSRCISALHRGALESDHALSVVTVFEITIYLIHVHRVSLRPRVNISVSGQRIGLTETLL